MVAPVNQNNASLVGQAKTTLTEKGTGGSAGNQEPVVVSRPDSDEVSISQAGLLLQPKATDTPVKSIAGNEEASAMANLVGQMFASDAPLAMKAQAARIPSDIIRLL